VENIDLSYADFAHAFGATARELDPRVTAAIDEDNFRLKTLSTSERDKVLLDCLERVASDRQVIGEASRAEVWRRGWQENLDAFSEDNSSFLLTPKFMRPNLPVRWQGDFYQPENPDFEVSFCRVLRGYLFSLIEELGVEEFHEFGAGTGWNLLHAAEFFGEGVELVGSDFVTSAVELIAKVGSVKRLPLTSRLFDMRFPDKNYGFTNSAKAAVCTFGAMEQLAGDIGPFIDFLIEAKPAVVINIEPAIETYDQNSLVDYLAYKFQSKRGYSAGLIELLEQHEQAGKISVQRIKRIGFGSMMMEGYNLFIWRPES